MGQMFDPESRFWKPFGYVADVVLLSCVWFVCAIFVLPLGAATCALYDCTARCIRGADKSLFRRFFRTARREFVPALLSAALWGALLGGGLWLIRLYGNSVAVTRASGILTAALLVLLLMLLGVACWVLPLLSRFTFHFGALQGTAVRLALLHPLRTLGLGASAAVCGYLCFQFWLPVLVLPALMALLWSLLLEPVFAQYMPAAPAQG